MLDAIISSRRIFLGLEARSKPELLADMVGRLAELGEVRDPDRLTRLLVKREELITTGVKYGFAFPHVFSPQIDKLILTIGVIPGGTEYQSLDGKPTEFILLLLGPPSHQDVHLRVLARLSRIATGPGTLEELRASVSPEAVASLFTESDKRLAAK